MAGAVSCGWQLTKKTPGDHHSEPVVSDSNHSARGLAAGDVAHMVAHADTAPVASSAPAPATGLAPAAHIQGDQFVDDAGNPIHLHGFSWFGFNDGTDALGGLWTVDSLADFSTTVYRQKLLGFNAVRLPFSFAAFNKEPKKIVHACKDMSDDDIVRSTLGDTDKGIDISKAPKLPKPPKREPGQCNGYIEGNTVREQLLWTTKFYVDQGFYVLLDNHYREDKTAEDDQKGWEAAWASLAKDVLGQPDMVGRVFFDLLNEPEQYGQMWEPSQKVGLKTLYLAAMDAIDAVSDKSIYFLEGTGHSSLHSNWGDGYCTDAGQIQQLGLADIRPFLTALAQKPYHDRVVLAPHVYGPSVTYATADFSGAGLFNRLNLSFGHFTKEPFEAAGQKLLFPVAIGEFGSHFTDAGDKLFMTDFSSYLRNDGRGKDDKHDAIPNWFYWCWNVNSGDTGGLVKEDWTTLEWGKLQYLEELGLTPWHKSKSLPVEAPKAPNSAVAPPALPTPPPAPAPAPVPANAPKDPPVPSKQPVVFEGASSSASIPRPSTPDAKPAEVKQPEVKPLAPVAKDGKIHVRVLYNTEWETEGQHHFVYNLQLTNTSGAEIKTPYDIEVQGPKFTALGEAWNMTEQKVQDGNVLAKVTASWATLPPDSLGTANIGFIGLSDDKEGKLKSIKVAGQDVVIEQQ